MEVYLVNRLTFFAGNPRIDSFHYTMFHGLSMQLRNRGDSTPLQLTLNAHRINHLIQPAAKLVMSQCVADSCHDLPGVKLREVVLKKVVNVPYHEGDFSHWDDPEYQDDGEGPDRVLLAATDAADLRGSTPRYYELVVPSYYDIDWEVPDAERITIKIGPTDEDEVFDEKVSKAVLEHYSVVGHMAGILFHERAFERIERYLNRDYFLIGSAYLRD